MPLHVPDPTLYIICNERKLHRNMQDYYSGITSCLYNSYKITRLEYLIRAT